MHADADELTVQGDGIGLPGVLHAQQRAAWIESGWHSPTTDLRWGLSDTDVLFPDGRYVRSGHSAT